MSTSPSIPASELNAIRDLYYVQKRHMSQIAGHYNVSIDAVASFMRRHNLKRRTPAESNDINYERKRPSFMRHLPLTSYERELEIAGVMLYWAEGYKSVHGNTVDFANSDPVMIKVFLNFIRTSFVIDETKLRVYLYCYSNQNVVELIQHWSSVCNISQAQFSKPYVRTDFDPKQKRKMAFGMIHVRYHDKKLLLEIKDMIHSYSLSLLNQQDAPIV
jgi:hypothetical protein